MIFKSLTSFSAILLAISHVASADDYTVTQTNYITPPCLKAKADSILSGNPADATAGIPIKFVYANADSTEDPNPAVTASDLQYTFTTQSTKYYTSLNCGADSCQTNVVPQIVTDAYTSSTRVTYTSLKTALESAPTSPSTTKKQRSTIYEYDTETDVSVTGAVVTKSAPTTTTTIFKATTVPVTVRKAATSVETITTTQRDPLNTQPVVSKALQYTIPTTFSSPVTISKPVNSSSADPSTQFKTVNSSSIAPSTALFGGAPSSSAVASNSSTTISSSDPQASSSSNRSALDPVATTPGITTGKPVSGGVISAGPSATNENNSTTTASSVPTTLTTVGKYVNSTMKASSSVLSTSSTQNATSLSSAALSSQGVSSTLASSAASSSSSALSSSSAVSSSALSSGAASSSLSSSSASKSASSSASSSAVPSASSNGTQLGASGNPDDYTGDLFTPISTEAPLSLFTRQELPLTIPQGVDNNGAPIPTNKFHANLFLGDQTETIWPLPYGMFWKKDDYYGFGITHSNSSDYIFGTGNSNNADVPSYYFSAIGNAEVIFSATTFSNSSNNMRVTNIKELSVLVTLSADQNDNTNYLDLPVVQGMGFVTGVYNGNLTPLLNTLIGFNDLTQETSAALSSTVQKYRATLFNGGKWLIYVTLPNSNTDFKLTASDSFNIKGSSAVDGLVIQVAYAPADSKSEGFYDEAAGSYATDAVVTGSVSGGTAATYNIEYTTKGNSSSGEPIVFALPHQVQSLAASTQKTSTGIELDSNTKGVMSAYLSSSLTMEETLNTNVQFLPWTHTMTSDLKYTSEQLSLLAQTANEELAVDIADTVASMDSTYYSGKVIDKYAYILLVVSDIIKDEAVTNSTLEGVKQAFDIFFKNKQFYPFMYDTKFGGVTSTAAQSGDTGADFGASYYNDHHFHYGYYVHAAAIVGYVDKKLGGTWAEDNKDWINNLVRDVANPSSDDSYFPISRMFDWYHGHSWAAGLFVSGDGKNEESSSEDYNFAYGMKMWGNVIGDDAMQSRGDLMLSIMSRAMNMYFLYSDDNTVEPSKYIPNKVSGIIFENKIAYTTYFGSPEQNPEYVHGIHMLPITPASSIIRIPSYVQQEWNEQISTFINNVDSGWTGILRLNQALYDAQTSYDFFSSSDWKSEYLDNGQSRTWSLAFSGGVANSS